MEIILVFENIVFNSELQFLYLKVFGTGFA